MKHLIIFFIIIVGIITINYLSCNYYESFDNMTIEYEAPTTDIKSSKVGSRGVFANKNYVKDEILEVCPCIKQDHNLDLGRVADYLFNYNDKESLIAFGYCSMYNHSDKPNAEWHIIDENKMKIVALKNIKKGEEIFISYGENYWDHRKDDIKN